jgi:16S rRNA (cytidine1402-2'-O)-methyltransferase
MQLAEEERTIIFYEPPHRLIKTLKQLAEYFGNNRMASVSRELSKLHEENIRGTLEELLNYYENNTLKGEIVLVVAGNKAKK